MCVVDCTSTCVFECIINLLLAVYFLVHIDDLPSRLMVVQPGIIFCQPKAMVKLFTQVNNIVLFNTTASIMRLNGLDQNEKPNKLSVYIIQSNSQREPIIKLLTFSKTTFLKFGNSILIEIIMVSCESQLYRKCPPFLVFGILMQLFHLAFSSEQNGLNWGATIYLLYCLLTKFRVKFAFVGAIKNHIFWMFDNSENTFLINM